MQVQLKLLVLGTMVGLFVLPTAASGASISYTGGSPSMVSFSANAGESNTVQYKHIGRWVQIQDSANPVASAPAGCSKLGEMITCKADVVLISLGDQDDIVAGVGADTAAIATTVSGDEGDDQITLGDGPATVTAGAGNDTLEGGRGDDVFVGDSGDDNLYGSDGNDVLSGEDGEDVILGEGDDDTLDGGEETDHLYGLAGADTMLGGSASDSLYGGEGDDTLSGGDGGDELYGMDDDDTLNGNSGNDTLNGDSGADTISGGSDGDTVSYADRSAALTVTLDELADDGEVGEHDLVATDVETVEGGKSDDQLTARLGSATTLIGGKGNDTLDVGEANSSDAATADSADCGEGEDTVYANSNDMLSSCEQTTVSQLTEEGTTGQVADTNSSVDANSLTQSEESVSTVSTTPTQSTTSSDVDRLAPVIRSLKLNRKRISLLLSEAGTVKFVLYRASSGRKAGGRCLKATKKLRSKKRCTRYVKVATLTRSQLKAGVNTLKLNGKFGKHKLKVGARYRVKAVATDQANNNSKARTSSTTRITRK